MLQDDARTSALLRLSNPCCRAYMLQGDACYYKELIGGGIQDDAAGKGHGEVVGDSDLFCRGEAYVADVEIAARGMPARTSPGEKVNLPGGIARFKIEVPSGRTGALIQDGNNIKCSSIMLKLHLML
ncbi:MAG: hypothetical protein WBK43_00630 [Prolixibacteraceae bacterium]